MSNDYIHSYEKKKELLGQNEAEHPIWRGVGCIIVAIVPIFSYILAKVGVDNFEFMQRLLRGNYFFSKSVDLFLWDRLIIYFIPDSATFFSNAREFLGIEPVTYFWGALLIAFVMSFLVYSIISIAYSISRSRSNIYNQTIFDISLKEFNKENKKRRKRSKRRK